MAAHRRQSVNESHERDAPAGAKVPVWVKLQLELREQGIEIPPVPVVDDRGAVLPETRAVFERIAHHGLLLATGHLARDEIFAVVDAALEAGRAQIVITHPEFPAQNLSVEDQRALAGRGALLERCFTTPHTGKIAWESGSRTSARPAPSTRCCRPISGRCSTRRWRTGWRSWWTACWRPGSTTRRST